MRQNDYFPFYNNSQVWNCCIDEYCWTKYLQDSPNTEHLSAGGSKTETPVPEKNAVKVRECHTFPLNEHSQSGNFSGKGHCLTKSAPDLDSASNKCLVSGGSEQYEISIQEKSTIKVGVNLDTLAKKNHSETSNSSVSGCCNHHYFV